MVTCIFDFENKANNAQEKKDGLFAVNDKKMSVTIEHNSFCTIHCTSNFIISVDGFFYNDNLIRKKYGFSSNLSNAEVIANLVEHNILDLSFLQGKFSIIIIDRNKASIVCAVDKFAENKLCYCIDSKRVIVATKAKDVAKIRNDYTLDNTAIGMFFAHNYICAPLTIFKGVKKIGPSCMVTINSFNSKISKYWDVISIIQELRKKPQNISIEEAQSELLYILEESIKMRKSSLPTVRPALLLSGGIDSSLLCRILRNEDHIKAYTASFDDSINSGLDESCSAQKIADYYGVTLEVIKVNLDQFKDNMLMMQRSSDEPMANKSYPVADYLIGRAVFDGNNTIYTGDGGDELFMGYPRYQRMNKIQKIYNHFHPIEALFKPSVIKPFMPIKFQDIMNYSKSAPGGQLFTAIKEDVLSRLLANNYSNIYYSIEGIEEEPWYLISNYLDLYYGTQAAIRKWNDITQSKNSYHFSPILDERMIRFSAQIPENFKMTKHDNKLIMRNIIDSDLTEISKLPKHGFTVPVQEWIRTSFVDMLNKYTEKNFVEKQGIFNAEVVHEQKERFMDRKSSYRNDTNSFIFDYFVFQNWLTGLRY